MSNVLDFTILISTLKGKSGCTKVVLFIYLKIFFVSFHSALRPFIKPEYFEDRFIDNILGSLHKVREEGYADKNPFLGETEEEARRKRSRQECQKIQEGSKSRIGIRFN